MKWLAINNFFSCTRVPATGKQFSLSTSFNFATFLFTFHEPNFTFHSLLVPLASLLSTFGFSTCHTCTQPVSTSLPSSIHTIGPLAQMNKQASRWQRHAGMLHQCVQSSIVNCQLAKQGTCRMPQRQGQSNKAIFVFLYL